MISVLCFFIFVGWALVCYIYFTKYKGIDISSQRKIEKLEKELYHHKSDKRFLMMILEKQEEEK